MVKTMYQIQAVEDLESEMPRLSESELRGLPLYYCLKTGRLWPKPNKVYDVFIRMENQND